MLFGLPVGRRGWSSALCPSLSGARVGLRNADQRSAPERVSRSRAGRSIAQAQDENQQNMLRSATAPGIFGGTLYGAIFARAV